MPGTSQSGDRATFERLVAGTTAPPDSIASIRRELEYQTLLEADAARDGLDELAGLLARHFGGQAAAAADVAALERACPATPAVHIYAFALHREAGAHDRARASLDRLLAIDPSDPLAAHFDAALRERPVAPASEEQRLANIARIAATPLLSNPYSLAVGVMFEALRARERARVLDVGIGGGAQMAALLALLAGGDHAVRRLEIVALDFMPEFLERAEHRIAEAAEPLRGRTEVAFVPLEGRIEALDHPALAKIAGPGIDAANASIALHEVPGEGKLAALGALRRLAPARLVIAEWNYCMENVLPTDSTAFVFNVRSASAADVAALREEHGVEAGRTVVRQWLSQGAGQLTCPAAERQECFLPTAAWRALLEHAGFEVLPADRAWLAHATHPDHAAVAGEEWYVETSRYGGTAPITLLVAQPGPARSG